MYPDLNGTLAISLGDTSIGLYSGDRDFVRYLRERYRAFVSAKLPEFTIEFHLKDDLTLEETENRLRRSCGHAENCHYWTEPELIECDLDWDARLLSVTTDRMVFDARLGFRLTDLLLRGLYPGIYRKVRNTEQNAYLVHGCGIAEGDRAFLFTGPSGSGKTTVAGLAGGRKILNDEAVLLAPDERGLLISGTPFTGGVPEQSSEAFPLEAIFFLKHGTQVSVRKLGPVDTYKRILLQVLDTSPLFENKDQAAFAAQADFSALIASNVSAYELAFLPDDSFWPDIQRVTKELAV